MQLRVDVLTSGYDVYILDCQVVIRHHMYVLYLSALQPWLMFLIDRKTFLLLCHCIDCLLHNSGLYDVNKLHFVEWIVYALGDGCCCCFPPEFIITTSPCKQTSLWLKSGGLQNCLNSSLIAAFCNWWSCSMGICQSICHAGDYSHGATTWPLLQ